MSDTTGQTQAIPEDFPVWRILQAISDPNRFLPRGSDSSGEPYTESIPEWSARAVRKLLGEWFAGHTVVELPRVDGEIKAIDDAEFAAWVMSYNVPVIHLDFDDGTEDNKVCAVWRADLTERIGLALIALAREARRLASESSQDGEPNG